MTKKKIRLITRTLTVAVIVLGAVVYFITICWNGLGRTYVEEGWKVATGTILNPDLTLSGKKNIERKEQGIEQTINYEYHIDGKSYHSNSVSKELFVLAQHYPEGKTVNVYYNPADPMDVVLIRAKVQKQYLYAMMVFCMFVAFTTVVFLIKDIKTALTS